jgi:preprotein translocase subunit YajC
MEIDFSRARSRPTIGKIFLLFIVFLVLVFAVLYSSLSSRAQEQAAINELKETNSFYFEGKVVHIGKFTSGINGLVIDVDTVFMDINMKVTPDLFHGLYSKEHKKIIFYGSFSNEDPANLPRYMRASSKADLITYDPPIDADLSIRVTKLYGQDLQELAVPYQATDWIYF